MLASLLMHTDFDKDFLVCTDASGEGTWGVLMQGERAMSYKSRELKVHKQNYQTHDLELSVIVHALKA
jgi:hypothetical protein